MLTEPKTLRARLLDAEPASAARRRQLELEINNMLTNTLTCRGRWYWILSLLASITFTGLGIVVLSMGTIDGFIRAIWWIYTLANAGFVILAGRILLRNRVDHQNLLIAGKLSPVLTLVITLVLFVRAASNPTMESMLWLQFGIVFLIVAFTMIVYGRIVAAEWRQREQALRMELRIEDLIERLGGDGNEGPGVTADIR